jgi:D-alanyl-lipoteichoic acid acyltransferase DltB (MBOAT superfamily)
MLFNSYQFIFGFLPITLLGFYLLGARRRDWALLWLTAASLFFYAWWRPINVLLIAPSILINLGLARLLARHREQRPALARLELICGIVFNLCFLGYFKYTMFLEGVANDVVGTHFVLTHIILPLGISFITFQKIAFLADVHAGRVSAFTLREYALFVLFFPQLIAGPIVHYREMMPQFRAISARFDAENVSVGLTLFSMGLAKKLLLADPLAPLVSPLYQLAASGRSLGLIDGWIAGVGFLLQVYFDFSGYSDMALGLARFFGIKLPVNFFSPLKTSSIVDYWLRWHQTLTRFLTAYIYNPLTLRFTRAWMASGRKTVGGRDMTVHAFTRLVMVPTLITMFVSGVWHGAGYTFLIFGMMHGVYITLNHAWRQVRQQVWPGSKQYESSLAFVGWVVTFLEVTFAIVMFRAPTVHGAVTVWSDMLGLHGVTLPEGVLARLGSIGLWMRAHGLQPDATSGAVLIQGVARVSLLFAFVLIMPNSLELLAAYEPAIGVKPAKRQGWLLRHSQWTNNGAWAVGIATITAAALLSLGQLSEFLYWQF